LIPANAARVKAEALGNEEEADGEVANRRAPLWHALPPEEAVAAVDSDGEGGLTAEEAARRLRVFGANALPEPTRRSALAVAVGQLASPLVFLLLATSGIAAVLGELGDAVVILVVVALNSAVGAFQEGRAARSLAALRRLTNHTARVVRDGRSLLIEAGQVVPGDDLELEAACQGMGICALADAAARSRPELMRLTFDAELPSPPFYLAFDRELRQVPRVRLVIDALDAALREGLR
jgi:magnesium-transporting ATPase (P-type)